MKHYCLSLACAAWVAVAAGESLAQDDTRTISVTGEGKVSAPPDMATIYTGVVTQSAEAAAALEANNKAVEKIMEVLKEHDVGCSNLAIQRQPGIQARAAQSTAARNRRLPRDQPVAGSSAQPPGLGTSARRARQCRQQPNFGNQFQHR